MPARSTPLRLWVHRVAVGQFEAAPGALEQCSGQYEISACLKVDPGCNLSTPWVLLECDDVPLGLAVELAQTPYLSVDITLHLAQQFGETEVPFTIGVEHNGALFGKICLVAHVVPDGGDDSANDQHTGMTMPLLSSPSVARPLYVKPSVRERQEAWGETHRDRLRTREEIMLCQVVIPSRFGKSVPADVHDYCRFYTTYKRKLFKIKTQRTVRATAGVVVASTVWMLDPTFVTTALSAAFAAYQLTEGARQYLRCKHKAEWLRNAITERFGEQALFWDAYTGTYKVLAVLREVCGGGA